jgi:hypothetical protein
MGAFTQLDNPNQPNPQTGLNPNPTDVSYGLQQPIQPAQLSGKGGSNVTYPGMSGQPAIGVPNKYSNTVQTGDNQAIPGMTSIRGKGI